MQLRKCFRNDQQSMVEEGKMLIEYATMNAIAIRKILKKYDKVWAHQLIVYKSSFSKSNVIVLYQLMKLFAPFLSSAGAWLWKWQAL